MNSKSLEIPEVTLKDGNSMPAIGLGTYLLRKKECRKSVEMALKIGYNQIDTAEVYLNESAIGKVIQNRKRSELFLTSKVRPTHLNSEDLEKSLNETLEKLNTSYIDLYLIHFPNDLSSLEAAFENLKNLQEKGKIRSVGVSNFDIPLLEKTIEISDISVSVNQVEFHPLQNRMSLLNFCRERDITVTAYSPLAQGKALEIDVIQEISRKYDKTPAQVILNWELEKGTIPIPKSKSEKHLEENIRIFNWELDDRDLEKIDSIEKEKQASGPPISASKIPFQVASFITRLSSSSIS